MRIIPGTLFYIWKWFFRKNACKAKNAQEINHVVMSGRKSRICKAKNLSANGVFVDTENLGLRKGQQVQLAFAINLGLVTKIFIAAPPSLRT